MGFTVVLEDERGERLEIVGDPSNHLHRLLPQPDDKKYRCLGFIDRYGDTVFNRVQVPQFLEEWRRLATGAKSSEEQALLRRIEAMAKKVLSEPHLYLKFYGD